MEALERLMEQSLPAQGRSKSISLRDAVKACELGALLVDLRETDHSDYKQFAVPEVLLMPGSVFDSYIDKLPDTRWIILADSAGNLVFDFYNKLIERGFSKICILSGGMVDWERLGLPIISDINKALVGSCVCQINKVETLQKLSNK